MLKRLLSSRSRGDITLALAAVIVFVGLSLMVALSHTSIAQALAMATSRQAEPYTELYFNAPTSLPKQVAAAKPAVVSFHITNHEAHTINYRTRVSLVENGRTRVLSNAVFSIADGDSLDIPVSFTTARPATNLELIIELPDQAESIHFRSQS